MKTGKRMLALILSAIIVSTSLTACGESSVEETTSDETVMSATETVENPETEAETEPEAESKPAVTDNLPEGLTFNGEDCHFFSTDFADTDAHGMLTRDDLTGEVLNDTILERNDAVAERLDVNFVYTRYPYEYETRNLLYDAVRTAVMGGDNTYDIIPSAVYFNSNMIAEGLMTPINKLPYVQLDQPYWFDGFNSTATINGKTYMAASDATLSYLSVLYCLPFNVDMATDFQLPNLYAMVDEGTWTLDAWSGLISTMYNDENGNGMVDLKDRFGLEIINGNYIYSHLTSSEAGAYEVMNGEYVYTYDNERTIDLYDKLYALMFDTNNAVTINVGSRIGGPFMEGRSLFGAMMLYEAAEFRELSFDYSVLPYPKFDETQAEYHTCVGNNATVFMVPVTRAGNEKVGAVLEALSAAAYNSTTAAYYEETLQGKYANSPDMARMIQLLRDTEYMNIGDVFAAAIGAPHDLFKGTVMNVSNSGKWASTVKTVKKIHAKVMENFMKDLAKLDEQQ